VTVRKTSYANPASNTRFFRTAWEFLPPITERQSACKWSSGDNSGPTLHTTFLSEKPAEFEIPILTELHSCNPETTPIATTAPLSHVVLGSDHQPLWLGLRRASACHCFHSLIFQLRCHSSIAMCLIIALPSWAPRTFCSLQFDLPF
jgi:hypothetical protein